MGCVGCWWCEVELAVVRPGSGGSAPANVMSRWQPGPRPTAVWPDSTTGLVSDRFHVAPMTSRAKRLSWAAIHTPPSTTGTASSEVTTHMAAPCGPCRTMLLALGWLKTQTIHDMPTSARTDAQATRPEGGHERARQAAPDGLAARSALTPSMAVTSSHPRGPRAPLLGRYPDFAVDVIVSRGCQRRVKRRSPRESGGDRWLAFADVSRSAGSMKAGAPWGGAPPSRECRGHGSAPREPIREPCPKTRAAIRADTVTRRQAGERGAAHWRVSGRNGTGWSGG